MDCRSVAESFIYYTLVPSSLFFNMFAFYVIKQKSTYELATYKVVLLITCVIDLIHTVYFFLIDVVSFQIKNCFSKLILILKQL